MTLLLTVLRSPSPVDPDRKEVTHGPFAIGRSLDNDWVLPDPYRLMSRHHCVLAATGTIWNVVDLSANGTFVNDEPQPIGRDSARSLQDGDRLRFGGFEVSVAITRAGAEEDTLRRKPQAVEQTVVHPPPSGLATTAPALNAAEVTWDGSATAAAELTLQDDNGGDLLAAFLRGAGVPHLRPGDPVRAMEELGAAFRALVAGVRQTLQARAAVKDEFRIDQTTVRARGNNPLKFAADDEDALAVMLKLRRPGDMGAAAAATDAMRDIRIHELASVTAMREAVTALLKRLEPERIGAGLEPSGFKLLQAQSKGRAWDAFEALYRQLTEDLADDFDSVFGRAFAEAYERAAREIAASERGK